MRAQREIGFGENFGFRRRHMRIGFFDFIRNCRTYGPAGGPRQVSRNYCYLTTKRGVITISGDNCLNFNWIFRDLQITTCVSFVLTLISFRDTN